MVAWGQVHREGCIKKEFRELFGSDGNVQCLDDSAGLMSAYNCQNSLSGILLIGEVFGWKLYLHKVDKNNVKQITGKFP